MDADALEELGPVHTVPLRSRGEFVDYFESRMRPRLAVERLMAESRIGDERWSIPGFCRACRIASPFEMDWVWSDGTTPNFRERMICGRCGLNNRQRFMASLLIDTFEESRFDDTQLYMYEQDTAFFRFIKSRLPNIALTGSEYLGIEYAPGQEIQGIRHEDALQLTFADASLDAIISNDVFEHVPDIDLALAEAARVLKGNGRLFFTIPFHSNSDHTKKRARLVDGNIEMLLPPEYHGNPIDPVNGSLVFYDHGWDILERCCENGFSDAYALGYYDPLFGHLGGGLQFLFVADRAPTASV